MEKIPIYFIVKAEEASRGFRISYSIDQIYIQQNEICLALKLAFDGELLNLLLQQPGKEFSVKINKTSVFYGVPAT